MKNLVSLSGGKDSTAMLLRLLERGEEVAGVAFFDTGWEWPQMLRHIKRLREIVEITTVRSRRSLDSWLCHRGWPTLRFRWCTREKVAALRRTWKPREGIKCIGFAADETRRTEGDYAATRYPLIEWGMTEADCLAYCRERGYDWEGLYDHFDRVSCFCCPFQGENSLRKIRHHFPETWKRMLRMTDGLSEMHARFLGRATLQHFDEKFSKEIWL